VDDCLVCIPDGHIVARNKQRLTDIPRINCAPSWLYSQDWIITLIVVATVYTGKKIKSGVENRKQDRRYTYNAILRRVSAITVVVEKQKMLHTLMVCL